MKNLINKIKKLNWDGFAIVMMLCGMAAATNKSVHTFSHWLILMGFGFLFSLIFLIEGRKK